MRALVWMVPPAVAVAVVLAVWQGPSSWPAIVAYAVVALMVAAIVGFVQMMKRNDRFYRRQIGAGLERAWRNAGQTLTVELSELQMVVLSDQHKGTRDGADDFWRSERAYLAALGHYFELGHRLVVLGDAEELWECRADRVIASYRDVLALEAEYHADDRYMRVYGNHDDDWRKPGKVDAHLCRHGPFASAPAVHESIVLNVTDDGEQLGTLFLVHGHQGTADSEVFSRISRPAVSLFGWLQRKFNRPWNTPATDWELRDRHDRAMSLWAEGKAGDGLVLVTGHTHRPVFWENRLRPPADEAIAVLRRQLDAARDPDERAELRAEIGRLEGKQRWMTNLPASVDSPSYFNTGCCAFADGDITGLELRAGQIRLIRWTSDGAADQAQLPHKALAEVFEHVRKRAARRPPARV